MIRGGLFVYGIREPDRSWSTERAIVVDSQGKRPGLGSRDAKFRKSPIRLVCEGHEALYDALSADIIDGMCYSGSRLVHARTGSSVVAMSDL